MLLLVAAVLPVLTLLLITGGKLHTRARWGSRLARLWSRMYCALFGLRVSVQGSPPPSGSFAICNHVSHFDILVLTSLYPTSLVGKKEVRSWPLFGALAAAIGTVFVDREDRSKTASTAEQMRGYLASGATITLFPEGRTGDGLSILPFKRSLFAVPADLELPIYPAALHYSEADTAWCDDTPFVLHLFRLLCRRRQEVKLVFGAPIPVGLERKPLAFAAQAEMERLFANLHKVEP